MLAEYQRRLEERLNADPELGRRLQGFKTFAGKPDGHHRRARAQGDAAIATAVRCYPFGGTSALDGHELVGFHIKDGGDSARFVISCSGGKFTVRPGDWSQPLLALSLMPADQRSSSRAARRSAATRRCSPARPRIAVASAARAFSPAR